MAEPTVIERMAKAYAETWQRDGVAVLSTSATDLSGKIYVSQDVKKQLSENAMLAAVRELRSAMNDTMRRERLLCQNLKLVPKADRQEMMEMSKFDSRLHPPEKICGLLTVDQAADTVLVAAFVLVVAGICGGLGALIWWATA